MKHYTNFKPCELELFKPQRTRVKKPTYEPLFADTETSKTTYIDEDGVQQVGDAWVYIWAISIGKNVYYGRELSEFVDFLNTILNAYTDGRIVVYFHNLPYDASYLYPLLFNKFGAYKVLALSNNHPFVIKFDDYGLEFRCSYKLSNKSLDKWGKDLGIKNKKKVGTKDYNIVYTPFDDLPQNELTYMEYDILSLYECWHKQAELNQDTILTIPYTSTGYVRRKFKKSFASDRHNRSFIEKTYTTIEQYERQLKASQGGKTIGSMMYVGQTVRGKIKHKDYDSFYPTKMMESKYPVHPQTIYDKERGIGKPLALKDVEWYEDNGFYWVGTVAMKNVVLHDGVTCPFLSASKCKFLLGSKHLTYNNNVIQADYLETTITNFDFAILCEQFDFDVSFLAFDSYTTEYLPPYIKDVVWELYKEKTTKKDEAEQVKEKHGETSIEFSNSHASLMISKAHLNSIFGCAYTKVHRDEITITNDFEWTTEQKPLTEGVFKNELRRSPLWYAIGLFTCSMCRYELYRMIVDCVGYDNFLYCDTDSIFFIETEENKKKIEQRNAECQQDSINKGLYFIRANGKKKIMHFFDDETDLTAFRFLHAKCYAMETVNNDFLCTIAGVPQYSDSTFTFRREDELQIIDNLRGGFVFTKCGGTRATYNTHPYGYNKELGFNTTGGCCIMETTKELNDIDSYVYNEKWEIKQ